MKKILFSAGISAVEALGTVTRMAAIAEQVRKINPEAEILFRAAGTEAELIRKKGFKTIGGYKPNIFGFSDFQMKLLGLFGRNWDGTTPRVKSMLSVIRLKGLHKPDFVERSYSEWETLIREFKPDVIVSEFDFIAPIAARKAGIRHLTTIQTPGIPEFYSELFYKSPTPDQSMVKPYNKLLRKLGFPDVRDIRECFSGFGISERIAPSIPEMEDLPADSKTHFIGNLIMERKSIEEWKEIKNKPLIYVYLSVGGQIKQECLEKIMLEAFENSEFEVVVSTAGNPFFEKKGDFSKGNVRFMHFVPTAALLESADIAIHHGGQNSTLQCMAAKVPALIFAGLHFERFYNGRKAAENGCAYNLPNSDFNARKISELCRYLILNKPFKENLEKCSRKILDAGGSRRAAEITLE